MSGSFQEEFDLFRDSKISDKDKIFKLFFKIESLKGSIEISEAMLRDQESMKRNFFNSILKNSTDFDDFKTKYNKYVKFSKKMEEKNRKRNFNMNNENIQLHSNIFGFDPSLAIGNEVITKSNGKKGKIVNINESSIENNNLGTAKTSLKFNNSSTEVRNIRNLKRNTSRQEFENLFK